MKDESIKYIFSFKHNKTKFCIIFAVFASVLMVTTPCLAKTIHEKTTINQINKSEETVENDKKVENILDFNDILDDKESNFLSLNIFQLIENAKKIKYSDIRIDEFLSDENNAEPTCIIIIQIIIIIILKILEEIADNLEEIITGIINLIGLFFLVITNLFSGFFNFIYNIVNIYIFTVQFLFQIIIDIINGVKNLVS